MIVFVFVWYLACNLQCVWWRACIWSQPEASRRKPDSPQFLIFFATLRSYLDNDANIFYSKNIIPIRSNRSKTFLMCNQALRVPTEICDSKNISVCIKSRVDNLFKFLCLCLCLCMIILRAELITCSSSCALPQHLSFFCSSHYYCFFLCQTFTNASLLPNLTHFLCLSYSIYSLIGSSCIEGNL